MEDVSKIMTCKKSVCSEALEYSTSVCTLLASTNDVEKEILLSVMEQAIQLFKQKHSDLTGSEVKAIDSLFCFYKIMFGTISDEKLAEVEFEDVKNQLSKFDSDRYVYLYFMMLRQLFEMFIRNDWMKSARVLYGCMDSCDQFIKNGKKTVNNDKRLTASYLVVQEFQLNLGKKLYLNRLIIGPRMPEIAEIDGKAAAILKQLKDYKEAKDLPSEVKYFKDAEATARANIKVHNKLEETHEKYMEHLEPIQFLFVNIGRFEVFEPNKKMQVRAEMYEILSVRTEDAKLRSNLLKKANNFRMEHRKYIPTGNVEMSL
jgi:hypothetical protein